MKKLLSILGAVGLTTTAASTVVAFAPSDQSKALLTNQRIELSSLHVVGDLSNKEFNSKNIIAAALEATKNEIPSKNRVWGSDWFEASEATINRVEDGASVVVKATSQNIVYEGETVVYVYYAFHPIILPQSGWTIAGNVYSTDGANDLAISLSNNFAIDQLTFSSPAGFADYFKIIPSNQLLNEKQDKTLYLRAVKTTPPEGVDVTISSRYANPNFKPVTFKVINYAPSIEENAGYVVTINDGVARTDRFYTLDQNNSSLRLALGNGFALDQINLKASQAGYFTFRFPTWYIADSHYVDLVRVKPTSADGVELIVTKTYDNSPLQPITIHIVVK